MYAFRVAFVVLLATGLMVCVANAVVAPSEPSKPSKAPEPSCAAQAEERRAWIYASSTLLEGYSPAVFGMTASGRCGHVLRISDDDCSIRRMLAAYGRKPFMQRARDLGFDKLSCGFVEYDMADIVGR